MKVWDSRERNGYIFVWHHAENEPPTWELPSVPEIENGKWLYRGRSEFTVHCHIQVKLISVFFHSPHTLGFSIRNGMYLIIYYMHLLLHLKHFNRLRDCILFFFNYFIVILLLMGYLTISNQFKSSFKSVFTVSLKLVLTFTESQKA